MNIVSSAVTFNAPSHNAVGSPTKPDGSTNPYYQPAVSPTTWVFSPYGTKAALLQPSGQVQFNAAISSLGLSVANGTAIKALLTQQAQASGYGQGIPTDAAWMAADVSLSAGTTYTMSWNYIGTDYVPFNDGSITSLATTSGTSGATVTVNNQTSGYALLGFTNPGTGDYSTGTYGSTGWQVSTYEVSQTGTYRLGFLVFNLDDQGLSPVLLVDSLPGSTTKNGVTFGAVTPNNPNAPTVAPTLPATTTTTVAPTTTTIAATTTTTEAPTTTTTTEAPATTTTQAPIIVPITLPPIAETTSTIPETTTTVPPLVAPEPETLPITGNNSDLIFLVGFVLISLGLAIRPWARREEK